MKVCLTSGQVSDTVSCFIINRNVILTMTRFISPWQSYLQSPQVLLIMMAIQITILM